MDVGRQVPDTLADAEVVAADGARVRLGSLWDDADALVVFVRQFGCAGCSEHVAELMPRLGELDALGVRTAIVGSGSPEQMLGFVDRLALHDTRVRVFTDPSLASFRAAGLERSLWGTVGPVALLQLARAVTRGHRNSLPPEGDFSQQGGTLLVKKGGEIALYDRQAHLGDHAPLVDVVEAAMRLRASESILP